MTILTYILAICGMKLLWKARTRLGNDFNTYAALRLITGETLSTFMHILSFHLFMNIQKRKAFLQTFIYTQKLSVDTSNEKILPSSLKCVKVAGSCGELLKYHLMCFVVAHILLCVLFYRSFFLSYHFMWKTAV